MAQVCTLMAYCLLCIFLQDTFAWTADLPKRLQDAVAEGILVQPIPNVYILGTVHIGTESANDAKSLIETIQPTTLVLEMPPSRLKRLSAATVTDAPQSKKQNDGPLSMLFALGEQGWEAGGINGLLFATSFLWSGLQKRRNSLLEESQHLPRQDEFVAAMDAASTLNKCSVVACDLVLDELIQKASASFSFPSDWLRVLQLSILENAGISPKDPIQRRRNEPIQAWAARRRCVDTARLSREHGEVTIPKLSNVVLNDRNNIFAAACLESLLESPDAKIVCMAGLVHLDGICELLIDQ